MKYWIIVTENRKLWLPYSRRGNTHSELTCKVPPRLFNRLCSAKQALGWWQKGKWHTDSDGYLNQNKVTERADIPLIVIQVKLSEVSNE